MISRARIDAPDLAEVLHGKFNSFREHGHLVARLRRNVTPAQAGVLLRAVLRRDALRDDARRALCAELRRSLENAARFPPDVTDSLTDEQYVRNVVDVLYRR